MKGYRYYCVIFSGNGTFNTNETMNALKVVKLTMIFTRNGKVLCEIITKIILMKIIEWKRLMRSSSANRF